MAQTLIARGQATITIQKDGYTITQSLGEYIFPADQSGKILSAVSVTSTISVTLGDSAFTNFTIGTITKPTGFSSISVNNTNKTVTFAVAANTTTLADHGKVEIPIVISGTTYKLTFVWSKAKKGDAGAAGVDANLLDWVKEWNTGKTLINSNTVITPKLFAGTKNSDGTISGIAIGSFVLSTKTSSGTITTETVNGIYGFKDGFTILKYDAPRYFGGNLLNTDICDFALYAYRFPIDNDVRIHNIFVAGKEKMEFYVRPNPKLDNCATWMDFGTEQGTQYLNFHDINVYIPNGGRIYRYWKCRPLLQVSDNDEHFSHFTEDERLF